MNKEVRIIQLITTIVCCILIALHLCIPDLKIDVTTITLLSIGILPWLITIVKSVKLPNGTEINFQDVYKLRESSKKLPLSGKDKIVGEEFDTLSYLAKNEPNLALASLRIEIEKKLKLLYLKVEHGKELPKNRSISNIINILINNEILTGIEASSLRDIINILNRGVHAEDINESAISWALETGPQIIVFLDSKIKRK